MRQAKIIFILFILATCFCSCGSFGEGLLMGLSSMGNYGTYPSYGSIYQTNSTYTPSTTSSNNLDYLIDPNYTVAQYNTQLDQEFNEFSLYNKKPDGTKYTKNEWMNLRAQACSEMKKQESSNSRKTSNETTEVKSKPKNKLRAYLDERYGMKTCYLCKGTGKCATCNGRGYNENGFGSSGYHECPNCLLDDNLKPTGICRKCRGKGEIYGLLH